MASDGYPHRPASYTEIDIAVFIMGTIGIILAYLNLIGNNIIRYN